MKGESELYRGSRIRTADDVKSSLSHNTEHLGGPNTQVPGQGERRSTTEFTGSRNRSPSVWARRKTFVVPKKPAEPVVVAGPAEPEQLVRHRAQRHPPRADVDSESQWDPEANRPPTPTALKFPFPAPSSAGRSSLQRLDGSSRGSSRLEPRASRAECASRGGRGSGGHLGVRFSDASPSEQDQRSVDSAASASLAAASKGAQAARPSTSFTGALYSSEELDRMFRDIQADPDDAAAGSSAPAGPSVVVRREASVMGDEDLDERVAAMSCRVPPNLFSVPFLQPIKGWDPEREVHNNSDLVVGPTVAEYDWKGVHDSMNHYSFAEMLTLEDAMLLDLDSEAANRERGSLWMFNAERGDRASTNNNNNNNSNNRNTNHSASRKPGTAPPRCTSSLPTLPSYCIPKSITPRTRRTSRGGEAAAAASARVWCAPGDTKSEGLMRTVMSASRKTLLPGGRASKLHLSPSVNPRAFSSSAAVASINAEVHLEKLQECSENGKALAAFMSSVEEVRYLRSYFVPPEPPRKVAHHRIKGRHVSRAEEPWLGTCWEAIVTRVVDGADSLVPDVLDRPRQRALLQKALAPQIKRLKFIFNHYQTIPTMGLAPSHAVVIAAMRSFFRMAQEVDEDESSGPLHFDDYVDRDRDLDRARQNSRRELLKAARRFQDIASKATKTRRPPEASRPEPPAVAGREAPRPSPHAKRGTLQRLSTTRRLQVKSYVEGAYGDKIRTSDMVNFNESSRAHWTAVVVHAMDNPETGSMDQLWMCLRDCKVLSRELSISAINRAVYPPSEMKMQAAEGFAARWTAGLGGGTASEIAKQRRNAMHRPTFAKKAKSFYIDKEDLDPIQLLSHNLKGAAGFMVAPLGHEELLSKPEHLTGQIVLDGQEAKIKQLHRAFFDTDEDMAPPELDRECAAPKAVGAAHMRSRPIDLFFFTESLIRTAHLVVKDGTTVADRFHHFMEEKMRLACPRANSFMVAYLKPETLAVIKQYQAPLLKCFWFWAIERGASAMGLHRAGGVTMTYNDFLSMMTEMDFLNANLDPKRLTKCFGHSVGHSELLSQIHPNNQECEMMFDEFLECLTRCAVCLAGATDARALHVELENFIANEYLMKMANLYPSRL